MSILYLALCWFRHGRPEQSEEVLNETRSGSTVLLEPTYLKYAVDVGWLKRSGANIALCYSKSIL